MLLVRAVSKMGKLLFGRIVIIQPNMNRMRIVTVMQCCHLCEKYNSFKFIVKIIINHTKQSRF